MVRVEVSLVSSEDRDRVGEIKVAARGAASPHLNLSKR